MELMPFTTAPGAFNAESFRDDMELNAVDVEDFANTEVGAMMWRGAGLDPVLDVAVSATVVRRSTARVYG